MVDLRVLVLACLTNNSLKYRGAHLEKVKKQNLEINPFPDGQPVKIFQNWCNVIILFGATNHSGGIVLDFLEPA